MDKQTALARIRKTISDVTRPESMDKSTYREVLEEIAADVDGHLAALDEEEEDDG